jgi:hypothetical protein
MDARLGSVRRIGARVLLAAVAMGCLHVPAPFKGSIGPQLVRVPWCHDTIGQPFRQILSPILMADLRARNSARARNTPRPPSAVSPGRRA